MFYRALHNSKALIPLSIPSVTFPPLLGISKQVSHIQKLLKQASFCVIVSVSLQAN